jgi:GT2 family glycosyltransferase
MNPKVFIGIPNTGTVVTGLAELICFWSGKANGHVDIMPYFSKYGKPMVFHRNHIVNQFLKTECDYLLWIDDDVVPPPNALYGLTEDMKSEEVDAVTTICFCTRPADNGQGVYPYPVTMKDAPNGEFLIHYCTTPFEEIDACGGGCVMVKRRVYEHPDMKVPYKHEYQENGEMGMTCDFGIWRRAKKLGFKLWADNRIICSHIKEFDLRDYNDALAREHNAV